MEQKNNIQQIYEKGFWLQSYIYSQLLQIVHEQMLFVSLEASFFIMNRRHPNEPIFFHHSTQKQGVQQYQSCNL